MKIPPSDDAMKHIRQTLVDRLGLSWCGEELTNFDWAFLDIDHAANTQNIGSRMTPCSGCVNAIVRTLLPNAKDDRTPSGVPDHHIVGQLTTKPKGTT